MSTKCRVVIGFCTQASIKNIGFESPWNLIQFDKGPLNLEFQYSGDASMVYRSAENLMKFSVEFANWLETKRGLIRSTLIDCGDVKTPSFYVKNDELLGLSEPLSNSLSGVFVITWPIGPETDFVRWLDSMDLDLNDDFDQIYDLHTAVSSDSTSGDFVVEDVDVLRKKISSTVHDVPGLVLDEGARKAFASYIDSLFELGIEGEAAFRHALNKED